MISPFLSLLEFQLLPHHLSYHNRDHDEFECKPNFGPCNNPTPLPLENLTQPARSQYTSSLDLGEVQVLDDSQGSSLQTPKAYADV